MRLSVLLPFAIAGVLAAGAPAPTQERPTFGVRADLVVLDLVAWDRDGRTVTDLRPEEVEVYEDGKRQTLEFVQLVRAGPPAPVPTSTSTPEAPPSASPDGPATAGLVRPEPSSIGLVVVVDLMTMNLEVLARTRQAIIAMVRTEVAPGTRLMLATVNQGLQVRQPFTSDVDRFVAAVEALSMTPGARELSAERFVADIADACAILDQLALVTATNLSRMWVENVRLGVTASTEGLGALARSLAPLPGRKHVVFFSGGYAMDPAALTTIVLEEVCVRSGANGDKDRLEIRSTVRSHQKVDTSGLLRTLLDEANRAQVSVYTVDARGLLTDTMGAGTRIPTRLAAGGGGQRVMRRAVVDPQELLGSMADGTGGTASLNSNELARGLRAAAADAYAYYLVGYAPVGARKEGRFYPVEVKVRRDGLRVRSRKGYEWLSDAKRNERGVSIALRYPTLYAEDGLAVEARVEGGRLKVAAILPTRALDFRRDGGQYANDIALFALLRDDQGKMVGDRYLFAKTVTMKLSEARYSDLRSRDNVEIPTDVEAPKAGRYTVTLVARHGGDRLSSAMTSFDAP